MEKEKQKRIDPEQAARLTRELFHQQYRGNPEAWFAYLCPESVYLGTGEPLLFGGEAIREHFAGFTGKPGVVIQEEYFPISLGPEAVLVSGHIVVKSPGGERAVVTRFTSGYRLVGGEIKLVHQHNSYEYLHQEAPLRADAATLGYIRDLLMEYPAERRVPVRTGGQTLLLDPRIILYVQSQRKHTEVVCLDRVISCASPIGELAGLLPECFYPIHRGYLVNTKYIVALRRFEAELVTGACLPIPAASYTRVRKELAGGKNLAGTP